MSIYSFKITKGKYQLILTTTDREFVTGQFAQWVRKTAEYVQHHKVQQCKELVNSQINAEKEITQQKIDEQLKRMPKPEVVEEPLPRETSKNLDIFYTPGGNSGEDTEDEPPIEQKQTLVEASQSSVDFDNILEKSMQVPQTELSFKPNPTIRIMLL